MEKAKVIKKKETGIKAFLFEKKGWAVVGIAIVLLLLIFTAVPLSDIPGLGRLAAALGISDNSMRSLRLSDLAAYGVGVKNNRIAAAQFAEYDQFASAGGISPFVAGALTGDRLLNAREAYLKEYQATGRYPEAVAGPLSMAQTQYGKPAAYEGVAVGNTAGGPNAPIIDAKRVEAGENGQNYGDPIFAKLAGNNIAALGEGSGGLNMNLAGQKGQTSSKMTLPKLPAGVGIGSMSGKTNYFEKALEGTAGNMKMGRLGAMGGFTPIVSRVNTKAGDGQMGAFGGIGRPYIFSYNAKIAGYKVAAKNLAEAAFDGAVAEEEGLIVPGEAEERVVGDLRPPNTTISKLQANSNKCNEAKAAIRAQISQMYKDSKKTYKEMLDINGGSLPGSCRKFFHPRVYAKREQWNGRVTGLKSQCEALKELEAAYAGACSVNYNPSPKQGCANVDNMTLNKSPKWRLSNSCRKRSYHGKTRVYVKDMTDLVEKAFESEILGVKPDFMEGLK